MINNLAPVFRGVQAGSGASGGGEIGKVSRYPATGCVALGCRPSIPGSGSLSTRQPGGLSRPDAESWQVGAYRPPPGDPQINQPGRLVVTAPRWQVVILGKDCGHAGGTPKVRKLQPEWWKGSRSSIRPRQWPESFLRGSGRW